MKPKSSKLDIFCRLTVICGLSEAQRICNVVGKTLRVTGYSENETSAMRSLSQVIAKGFASMQDLRQLCEFFPKSILKVLSTLDTGLDVKITNFHEYLIDDLEKFNEMYK